MDADVAVDLLRKRPFATAWFANLEVVPSISGLAALEVAFGAFDKAEFGRVQTFLADLEVVWPEASDVERALNLASFHLSQGTGFSDAITAAIAARRQEPILTFNVKHYAGIPGVATIRPYVR